MHCASVMSTTEGMPLTDLLHYVPRLADFLPPQTFRSLLSCNKQTRDVVHDKAVKVIIHLDTSSMRHGLALQTVKLLSQGSWTRLQHIEFECTPSHDERYWKCRTQLRLPAVSELIKASWPDLTTAAFRPGTLDNRAVARLATANWHALTTLHISDTALSPASMDALCTATWPLQTLPQKHLSIQQGYGSSA